MANAIWQATIVDQSGNVLPGAEVEVVNESTGLSAPLFTTRTGTSKSNPFFADANGFAQFYAAQGLYRITATSSGTGTTITWRNVRLVDVATNAEALAGTADVLPDAAGVKAYVGQFGLGESTNGGMAQDWGVTGVAGVSAFISSAVNGPLGSTVVQGVKTRSGSGVATSFAGRGGRFFAQSVGTPWYELHHTGNILTTTGTSTEFPMSQKAVTDELNTKAAKSGGVFTTDITVNGLKVGRGGGNVLTNTTSGSNALNANTTGVQNTANGANALYSNTIGSYNTASGYRTLYANTTGVQNTANGYNALSDNTTGSNNTASGYRALNANTTGEYNTASGINALAANTTFINCSGFGNNSQVTGSHQVQLGNSGTTTYAYGTVQNRSDIRDKTDVRDTALGLDFINALRPVDFRWDMREDYRQDAPNTDDFDSEDEYKSAHTQWLESIKLGNIEHDGTHKRSRYHHGLIAQEVKAVIDNSGIDFGGFQDHKLSGGDDVLSLGYEELIAPLIKAVQELTSRIDTLESKE